MNLSALRDSGFRAYFFGAVCAVNGLWALRVTLGWLAWDMTHSAQFVGIVSAAMLLPTLAFGPFFGVAVDRSEIIRAAQWVNRAMVLCAAFLGGILWIDVPSQNNIFAIALAIGIATAAHHPVRTSLAPRLVDKEDLVSVIALAALNFNLARMVMPAVTGGAISTWGVGPVAATAFLFFLPNAVIFPILRPRIVRGMSGGSSALAALLEGMRHAASVPIVIWALLATAMSSMALRGVLEILPVIADGVFGKGAIGLAQMGAAGGGGALLAALFKAMLERRQPNKATLYGIWSGGIFGLALLGFADAWSMALWATAILGFVNTYLGVSLQTRVQGSLSDAYRARVMSFWILVSMGMPALSALLLGFLTDLVGFEITIGLFVGSAVLGLAAMEIVQSRLRVVF